MVEDDNVDFDAFIEFSDLGLEDYIHNLDWDIKAKKFPLTNEIKIEEKMTNISDILNQQIQQSNSMTIEQITELEKNMKMVNNNFVNFTELNIIQEKTQEQNEKIKEELKEELKSQKDFFIDFLNS